MQRLLILGCIALLSIAAAGTGLWRYWPEPAAEIAAPLPPVPPFPPRIASGDTYEHCLGLLADDPDGARLAADAWAAAGGGDGAAHCQGLTLIATGRPDLGAERLEQLATASLAPDLAKATIFAQAAQAWLMVDRADKARDDATRALLLSPTDTELLILRAQTLRAAGRWTDAIADLTQALTLDAHRADALAMRAAAWRRIERLDLAVADTDRAIALDPDNAEALLERGIERQRLGNVGGARDDWRRALALDPNSTTADLAEQNLALLDAGPNQR